MLGITVAAQFVGRALRAGRGANRLAALAGMLMAVGAAALATLLRTAPPRLDALGAALLPIGLGLGNCFPLTTVVARRRAPPTQLGAASALPVMLRSLGGALGVALLGELLRREAGPPSRVGSTSGATAASDLATSTSTVFLWLVAVGALTLWPAARLKVGASAAPDVVPGAARPAVP